MPIIKIRHERGATLIFALIILLVMTIVGVSTMQSSTLQERMSSNVRQKNLARNAAEVALKTAEKWLLDNVKSSEDLSAFSGKKGLYSAIPRVNGTAAKPLSSSVDVTDADDWASMGVVVTGLSEKVKSQDPKYIIEFIGRGQVTSAATKVTQLNAGAATGDISPYFFRITAIGWSRDANIYSVLESTFRTGYGDGIFTY